MKIITMAVRKPCKANQEGDSTYGVSRGYETEKKREAPKQEKS